VALVLLAAAVLIGLAGEVIEPGRPTLRLATGTTLYDAGFWEVLEPTFEERFGIVLHILYAGTGKALEWGRRGDVDLVVIHWPPAEKEFVAQGYGVTRVPFAYNYFLIVGPADDPAGIAGLSPEAAFRRLFESGAGRFVSRGDSSGTHEKEKTLWAAVGFEYETVRRALWYVEAGRGMGPTLLMTSEKQAYTLTDSGTFVAFQAKLDLVPLVAEGEMLLNVYSAIAVDPERRPGTNIEAANTMIAFLTSPEIQARIGALGVEAHGMQLFTPCAGIPPCAVVGADQ